MVIRKKRIIGQHVIRIFKQLEEEFGHSALLKFSRCLSVLLYVSFAVTWFFYLSNAQSSSYSIEHGMSRRLLNANSSEPASRGLPWETCSYEMDSGVPYAWASFHFFSAFMCFIGLAVICDDFFVPSLELISEKLKLSEDVAGATFMAAGSSAPELFTSIIGVFQETDIGVGTIVGSAVFNILMIIAATGLLAKKVLTIDCRPLTRDIAFYTISILVYIAVSWNGFIEWYESLTLLSLYVLYIVVMYFNNDLMDLLTKFPCGRSKEVAPGESDDSSAEVVRNDSIDGVPSQHRGSLNRASFTGGHARRVSLIHALHSNTSALGTTQETILENRSNGPLPPLFKYNGSDGSKPSYLASPLNGRRIPMTSSQSWPTASLKSQHGVTRQREISPKQSTSSPEPRELSPTHVVVNNNNNMNQAVDQTDVTKISDEPEPSQERDVEAATETVDKSEEANEETEEEEQGIPTCPGSCCPRIKSTPPNRPSPFNCCCDGTWFIVKWILYVLAFPFFYLFTLTIPDCSKEKNRKYYPLTFVMSVLWIGAISFCMTTIASRFGCIVNFDHFPMGLVVIAVGTSLPDLFSSVLVARDGFGDMAVSNAIGSNVFDIDLGLGLPLLMKSLIKLGQPVQLLTTAELNAWISGALFMSPHSKFGFILCAIVLVVYVTFILAKFKLQRWMSVEFIVMYGAFLAYAFIQNSSLCNGGLLC